MESLCNGWEFTKEWTEDFCAGRGTFEQVRLPHTVQETVSVPASVQAEGVITGSP